MLIKLKAWLSCLLDSVSTECDDGKALKVTQCPNDVVAVIENCDGTLMYGITAAGNVAWTQDSPVNNTPPQLAEGDGLPPQQHTEGDQVSISISEAFTDTDGDVLTYSAVGLPDGLTIDPSTGVISGTLTDVSEGTYPVVITATDPSGGSVNAEFEWVVDEVPVVFTQQTNINYNHNDNGGTSSSGSLDNTACVAKTADIVFGAGLQYPAADYNGSPSTYEWVVSGVDTQSKADAIAAEDYIELTFATGADGAITNWYQGLEPQSNSTGAGGYNFALLVSDDNFATSTDLIADDYLRQPQTEGDNGNNTRVNQSVALNHPTEAGKTYTLRYYMWSTTASGPNGSALFPNTQNKLVEGTAAFDDVSIKVEC